MERMSVAYWCRVTARISDVLRLEPATPFEDAYPPLAAMAGTIQATYHPDGLVKLTISVLAGVDLFKVIDAMAKDSTRTSPLTVEEIGLLRKVASDYRTVLEAELESLDAYYVAPKAAFSTKALTDNADVGLGVPAEMLARLPAEAKLDIQQGGRCLAFELPTAVGFHVARATESVILAYMGAIACPVPKESQRNWGNYIKSLREHGASEKIAQHLEQIKDLYRNPLVHPEVTLSMPEAIALWSICTGVVVSMLVEMQRVGSAVVIPEESGK